MQPVSNSASKFLGHPHLAGTVLEIDQIRPWLFDFSCHWVAMSVITCYNLMTPLLLQY
jgi:hypothetical protein